MGEIKTWLGIGLIPSRTRHRLNPGHCWLFWDRTEKDTHQPFRGFYPNRDELPDDPRKRRKIYRTIGVTGMIIEDSDYDMHTLEPSVREKIITVQISKASSGQDHDKT